MSAALKGAGQIGFTLVSLTLSLIAVLIPLLFMEDVVGRLFREFAITLAVAILISLASRSRRGGWRAGPNAASSPCWTATGAACAVRWRMAG
ncbi:hypothetical protein G6F60_014852 [Rhizopus arrhizus]|nr:hypothetical protein G6F60_014852 [Rhizopus arrhizus]